jgi:hypothetical protein
MTEQWRENAETKRAAVEILAIQEQAKDRALTLISQGNAAKACAEAGRAEALRDVLAGIFGVKA